jgi:hypothetical protein
MGAAGVPLSCLFDSVLPEVGEARVCTIKHAVASTVEREDNILKSESRQDPRPLGTLR